MPIRQALTSTTAVIKSVDPISQDSRVVLLATTLEVKETMKRGAIYGIGDMTVREQPAQRWNGMISVEMQVLQFYDHKIGGINRKFLSRSDWEQFNYFFENEVTIELYDNVLRSGSTQENLEVEQIPIFKIEEAAWVDDGFRLVDQSVAMRTTMYTYTRPILDDGSVLRDNSLLVGDEGSVQGSSTPSSPDRGRGGGSGEGENLEGVRPLDDSPRRPLEPNTPRIPNPQGPDRDSR